MTERQQVILAIVERLGPLTITAIKRVLPPEIRGCNSTIRKECKYLQRRGHLWRYEIEAPSPCILFGVVDKEDR